MSPLPVLYSFRRCPYAIRARLALKVSGINYEHREISLKNKPVSMLEASPKGTVPVLVLNDGNVIDESLNIMLWALAENDPEHWLAEHNGFVEEEITGLININDLEFKYWLDRYKYSDRFPESSREYYRGKAEEFINELEALLRKTRFLNGSEICLSDMAILPFMRQFAHVDKDWFFRANYPKVIAWLNNFLESSSFLSVMKKHPPDVDQQT